MPGVLFRPDRFRLYEKSLQRTRARALFLLRLRDRQTGRLLTALSDSRGATGHTPSTSSTPKKISIAVCSNWKEYEVGCLKYGKGFAAQYHKSASAESKTGD